MGKFPFKRPRIISKKFPELDSSIEGVTKSLNDLVFGYHKQVQNALSKKHWLMAFSSIALLLVLGSFISQHGKADSSVFYPETCLGGWVNPNNAQGEQQTTSNGDEAQFTKENSAILPKNTNAEMYCGNFKGKFDTTTKPTKIIVALALTKGPELTHEDLINTDTTLATTTLTLPEIASSTTSSTLTLASSSEEITSTSTGNDVEASSTEVGTASAIKSSLKTDTSSVIDGVIESLKDTVRDIFNTSDDTKTQTDTIVVPPPVPSEVIPTEQVPSSPAPESPAQPSESPAQPPAQSPESPVSYLPLQHHFLKYFVSTVFAEEVKTLSTTTEAEVINVRDVLPVEEKVIEATSTEGERKTVLDATSTLLVSTTTDGIASATTSSSALAIPDVIVGTSTVESVATTTEESVVTTTDDQHTQNNFLEVFYTFNGEVWESLGMLNEISMKYRTFEIPVNASTSWSDMSKLQIKIEARKHEVDTPVVYLDGIKVEVLYETSLEHMHPDFTRDTILKDETIEDIRIVTLINSDTKREEVWYMYLDIASTSTSEIASSTLETSTSTIISTSTISASTTQNVVIKNDTQDILVASSTQNASSTRETELTSATSTPLIKPVIQKNVWFKFDGKPKDLSGYQLVEQIKKIDEHKLENKDENRVPDFTIDTVKKIKGTLAEKIVVQVEKDGSNELWLYDIENNTQEKIQTGSTTSISLTYPLGVKGGYLFWLSNDEGKIYAYHFESQVILMKTVPVFDGSKGERAEVVFEEIPWKVIISAEDFSFFSESTGEVFSDENSSVVDAFRKKLDLDSVLSIEELSELNLQVEAMSNDRETQ